MFLELFIAHQRCENCKNGHFGTSCTRPLDILNKTYLVDVLTSCKSFQLYIDVFMNTHGFCPPPLKTRGPGKMVIKIRGEIVIFYRIKGDFSSRAAKAFTKMIQGGVISK